MTAQQDDELASVVARYTDAARTVGDVMPSARQNAAAKELASLYSRLRDRGQQGINALIPLLDSPIASVRLWAASHLLPYRPDLGEPVLEALAHRGDIGAHTAEWTLRVWRRGELTFPEG